MSGREDSVEVLCSSLEAVALHTLFVTYIASGVSPADARVQKNSFPHQQRLFIILTAAMLLLKLAPFDWVSLLLLLQTVENPCSEQNCID